MFDDSLEIHERSGAFLAEFFNFQPSFGLRARDLGELLVYGFLGAHFFVLLGIHYFRSEQPTRAVFKNILAMVILLAVFGVIFDMVHIVVGHPVITPILGIMDDGGEMLVMSLIAWYVYRLCFTSQATA